MFRGCALNPKPRTGLQWLHIHWPPSSHAGGGPVPKNSATAWWCWLTSYLWGLGLRQDDLEMETWMLGVAFRV